MVIKYLKWTLLAFIVLFVLFAVQMYMYLDNINEARVGAVNQSVENGQLSQLIADRVIDCLVGTSEDFSLDTNGKPRPLRSVHDCSRDVGGSQALAIIEQADKSVNLPAPLRWIAS